MFSDPKLHLCRALGLALAATLLGVAAFGLFAPAPAVASEASVSDSSVTVRGADALTLGDSFECATVSGLGGSKLYADVTVGGKVVAKNLAYAYDDAADTFGVVQLDAKASYVAKHSGQMQISFYDAKSTEREDGATPLLEANVYAVCMTVDGEPLGSVQESMIGIRTAVASEAELAFAAPSQVVRNSITYSLVGSGKVAPTLKDGVLYVAYEKVDDAQGVSAAVVYVDENGNELARDSYTLAAGEQKSVDVRKSVEANGKLYTPAAKVSQLTLSSSNPEQRVWCLERTKGDDTTHDVTLTYVSTEGKQLMVDRVSVGAGGFLYAPASTFSQAHEAEVSRYALVSATDSLGNEYTAEQAASLALSRDGATEYTLYYAAEQTELTYTVNFALVSKGKGGNTNVSVLKSETGKVSASADATVALPATLEHEGVTYTRHGADESLSYAWADLSAGRVLSDTVYYVASDVVEPEAYDVTVRYVDAVSGTVLGSETLTCEPSVGSLSVTSPESVTYEGEQYERLGGQSTPITHRFYAPYRTYTVYYAKPGSMSDGDTTVIRTVVVDGGTRYYTIDSDGNVSYDGDASNGSSRGLVAGAPYTSISTDGSDGSEAGEVSTPAGESAYEERIANDATPLSGGDEDGTSVPALAYVAAAAVALALVAALLVLLRKRNGSSDDLNDVKGA